MNIFTDTTTLLGSPTAEHLQTNFESFLAESARVGARLGDKRRLLDAYLLCLFRLASREQAVQWAQEGENLMGRLRLGQGELRVLQSAHDAFRAEASRKLAETSVQLCLSPEWRAMQALHSRLSHLLEGDHDLERLGALFVQAFLCALPAAFFARGFLEDFMISLSGPDACGGAPLLCGMLDAM